MRTREVSDEDDPTISKKSKVQTNASLDIFFKGSVAVDSHLEHKGRKSFEFFFAGRSDAFSDFQNTQGNVFLALACGLRWIFRWSVDVEGHR